MKREFLFARRTYYARECLRCSLTLGKPVRFADGEDGHREALMHAVEMHPTRVVDFLASLTQFEWEGGITAQVDDDLLDEVLVEAEKRRAK